MKLEVLDAALVKAEAKEAEEEAKVARVIDILIGPKKETDDTEYPDDDHELELETSLSNALSLLEDCNNLLVTLADRRVRFITPYMHGEIERLSQEATVFLEQFEMGSLESAEIDV